MSASFLWEPVKPGRALPVNAPSSFQTVLEEAFGVLPLLLTGEHISVLKGIKAATVEREAVAQLMRVIEEYGEIKVWVVY